MNNCKNCQWYEHDKTHSLPNHGTCMLYADDELKNSNAFINFAYNFSQQHPDEILEFSVGENFGCIHFKLRTRDLHTGKPIPTTN